MVWVQGEADEIINQLAEKSRKPSKEIQRLVEEKRRKFSGLLTDSGAAFMVAKDLGLEVGLDSVKRATVSQLRDGMQNFDLLVRVMHMFSPKEFEKNGKKGKLCNLIVADSTGEIRLTVWHSDVKKLAEARVRRGSALLLHNCYAKSFNEKLGISLGFNGSMEAEPETELFSELPEAKTSLVKASALREGMNDIGLVGRVMRVFPALDFEKGQRKGKVMNFSVADETGGVRATAWNDLVEEAQALKENDLVRIEGAYTKAGLKGIELHLGWQARIEKALEKDAGIPEAQELLKARAERKKIVGLSAGDANVLIEGEIVAVNQGGLYYSVCPKCAGKVQALEEGIVCEKCGEVKEPGIRPVVSFRIDDGSGQINAVAYGELAEKIIGLEAKEIKRQAEERGREQMIEELQELAGKKLEVVGRVKENSFSNELEVSARLVEFK